MLDVNNIVEWIKEEMSHNGGTKIILGISGGKDSSVVAALCVKALGKENVLGILMPNGVQKDIEYAKDLVNHLDIDFKIINIESMVESFKLTLKQDKELNKLSNQTLVNLPSRVRMVTLYAIAQTLKGCRVANTSNLSEDWVGYATLYGDTAGAFSPLGMLTSEEVIELGNTLNLPKHLVEKTPEDGLTGKTDEDNFGFSYSILNKYIRTGICVDPLIKAKIDKMHKLSRFKFLTIPMFPNLAPMYGDESFIYPKIN